MDSKKIIFVWFQRFEEVNEGILRILAIITLISSILLILFGVFVVGNSFITAGQEDNFLPGILFIVGTFIAYWFFWVIVRVILWVHDGFKEST